MMMSQKDASTATKNASSPGAKGSAPEMQGGNRRFATPGTSGVPRSEHKSPKKTLKEPTRLEQLRFRAAQHTEKAKAELVIRLEAAKTQSWKLLEKAEPKTAAFRSRCAEFQGKATTKAQQVGASAKAHTAAKTSEAKTRARMLQATASAHLADWLEEIRGVGWWAHPAPLTLGCAVALVILFLGCSLGATWPVALAPHQASSFGSGPSASETVAAALPESMQEELPPVAPAFVEDSPSASLWFQYSWNTQRYQMAKQALLAHDFNRAHELLVGLSNEGALEAHGHWESFGNFSRAMFLADLGTTLVYAGDYETAVPILASGLPGLQAPSRIGSLATALNSLGVAYRNLGDHTSALGAFETATSFAPRNPLAWNNLGVVATEVGKLQQADDAFYYALESHGPGLEKDETLMNNVQVLRDRALGRPQQRVAAMELWYEA